MRLPEFPRFAWPAYSGLVSFATSGLGAFVPLFCTSKAFVIIKVPSLDQNRSVLSEAKAQKVNETSSPQSQHRSVFQKTSLPAQICRYAAGRLCALHSDAKQIGITTRFRCGGNTMRVFFTSYGQRSSGSKNPPSGQLMPPMIAGRQRLHFDVSPIFFAPQIIMDRRSLEAMLDNQDGLHEHGRETLRVFKEQGLIDIRDYRDLTEEDRTAISKANESDSEDRLAVARKALRIIDDWYEIGTQYNGMWGPALASSGKIPYAFNAYLQEIGRYDDVNFADQYWVKLKEGFNAGSSDAVDELFFMGETINDHHNTTARLSSKYGAASYHWRNLGGQDELVTAANEAARQWSGRQDQRERLVLEALVPAGFEETPPESLGRMFTHKKMDRVRDLVRQVAASNMVLPRDFENSIREALELENQKLTDVSQVKKWLLAPKMLLDWIPLFSTVADSGGTAIIEAIAEQAYGQAQDQAVDMIAGKAGGEVSVKKRDLAAITRFVSQHRKGNHKDLSRLLGLRRNKSQ